MPRVRVLLALFVLAARALDAAPDAPKDQYLYLTTQLDTDGFAPPRVAGQGDFDGSGRTFPESIFATIGSRPDDKKLTVDSVRHGKIVFLKPRVEAGRKNMMALRGQTIAVRTNKVFNVLFAIGASHAPAEPTPGLRNFGHVELTFDDGTRRQAPIAFSNWADSARFGEEVAASALYRAPPRTSRTVSGTRSPANAAPNSVLRPSSTLPRSGRPVHLWLQRTPIPEPKILRSIRFPDLPHIKIAALTLAHRRHVPAVPAREIEAIQEGDVAIFHEPGFPGVGNSRGATPEAVRAALEADGIQARLLNLDQLSDPKVFSPSRFPVAVLCYGDYFPVDALDALREYRKSGGAMVLTGAPFTRPCERTPYGEWIDYGSTSEFSIASGASGLGTTPRATVTRTRTWPTDLLESWGFAGLPWSRIELRDEHGVESAFQGIETRQTLEGMTFDPLMRVGQWTTAVACVVRQASGPFAGSLDVWTPTAPLWIDGRQVASALHVEIMARSAAWCLHERDKLSADRWQAIRQPLELADVAPAIPALPPVSERGLELIATRAPGSINPSRKLIVIPVTGLRDEERVLLASAQGLVNRRSGHLVALSATGSDEWPQKLEKMGLIARTERRKPGDLLDLVGHRRTVVVDPDLFGSLNLASTIASIEGLLVAYPGSVATHDLEVALDLRGTFESDVEMLRFAIDNILPRTGWSSLGCVRPTPDTWEIRDLLVAQRAFLFWPPSPADTRRNVDRGAYREALERALAGVPIGTPTFAWRRERAEEGDRYLDELLATRTGKRYVDLRRARNLSCESTFSAPRSLRPFRASGSVALDTSKVYVAVVADPTTTRSTIDRANNRRPAAAATRGGVRVLRGGGAARVEVNGTSDSRPGKRLPVPADAWEPGVEQLYPSLLAHSIPGATKQTFAPSYPPGLYLPMSLTPRTFGLAYGDARHAALDQLFSRVGAAMHAQGSRFLLTEANPFADATDWSPLAKHLPSGSAVFLGHTSRDADELDFLGSTRLVGGIPVVADLGHDRLREFLSPEALEQYRALRPFFTYTTAATMTRLQRDKVRDRSGVVFVEPHQLAELATEYLSKRALESSPLVAAGSRWRYHDQGQDLGTRWRLAGHDDSEWSVGTGEFGYGDANEGRPEATVLSYGDDASKKHPCYYFRTKFTTEKDKAPTFLLLELLADDGAVVHLNGREIFRFNMPEGEVKYATSAVNAYGGSSEAVWRKQPIDPSLLSVGENTLAVEVHQQGTSSSDLSFDLALTGWRVRSR